VSFDTKQLTSLRKWLFNTLDADKQSKKSAKMAKNCIPQLKQHGKIRFADADRGMVKAGYCCMND